MSELNNALFLKGGNTYITQNAYDAFRVTRGHVLIYIVPLHGSEPGRRSFLYEAETGEVFPGFMHRDMEYCHWRFCLVAVDEAELEIIENGATKVLKKRFAEKAKVRNFAREGFEGGLVDQYRINTVTEDGFIRRSQQSRAETSASTLKLIFDAFHKNKMTADLEKTPMPLYNAIALLCSRQHMPIAPFEKIKEACGDTPAVSDIARVSHFSYREIILTPGWHNEDGGALLVFDDKKRPLLCLPKGSGSYLLYDTETESGIPVSKKVAQTISPTAYMLYRPLPLKRLNVRDVVHFCIQSVKAADLIGLAILTLITSLISILTPTISQKLYDEYIPLGAKAILLQLGCVLAAFMVANILFSIVKNLISFRISSKISYDMQGAVYDRTFNLPESFFRQYDSAELAQRIMGAGELVGSFATIFLSSAVAIVFLSIYLLQMFGYSSTLTLIALLMIAVYAVIYYLISVAAIKYTERSVELEGKAGSLMFQFLTGIAKIRIAGVEDRALYEYMKPYVKLRDNEAKQNTIMNFSEILTLVADGIFTIVLYLVIVNSGSNISLGEFVAFNTVFGAFTAYAMQMIQSGLQLKGMMPLADRLKPILEAEPEFDDAKELPGELSGGIEINNVTFSYAPDAPNVLENISLNIRPGEYVGLVGSSGCGKSTLMKLLLGFETPTNGKIYYDNKDIENLDKRELRKKMGVVLQDGNLISGSIFENITITAPKATLADVQKVIKAVGLENDINEMPMGLHTILSEDCGTISGGQQQRILIARAIISNPKILFFDEATSALDNLTQKMVCDTLEQMDATRIVIAHRLSTIINCDRIIVLNAGKVEEEGTYEQLMANRGLFYQLASRQIS